MWWLALIVVCFFGGFYSNASAGEADQLRICYISPPLGHILPRALDKPWHHVGFRVAVDEYNATHQNPAEFIEVEVKKSAKAAPPQLVAAALTRGCHAVVGLVRSADALQMGAALQAARLVGFSSTAKSARMDEWYPNLLSASTSAKSWAEDLAVTLREEENSQNVLVLMRAGDAFSALTTESLRAALPRNARYEYLDERNKLSDALVKELNPDEKTAIIYTSYPLMGLPSLKQIGDLFRSHNWTVWANHTWTETQTLTARPQIIARSPPIFTLTPWDAGCANESFANFIKLSQLSHGVTPDHDSAYDYDTTNMILRCYEKAQPNHGLRSQILACLSEPFQFEGVTGVYTYSQHSHPIRPHHIYRITEQGLAKRGMCK